MTLPNPESHKLPAYPGFDWLRIILASVVVLVHEGMRFPGPIDGTLAVDVFFALSGWLIGGILLKTEPAELPRFFFNRATRIWLPYAAAIVLLYGFAAVYEGAGRPWWTYLFYDATFTHQLFARPGIDAMPLGGSGAQFWSISVEEQFYLLAPAIMLLHPAGKTLWPWLAIAAAGLGFGLLGTPIALGVIAAILHRDHGDWHLGTAGRTAVLAGTAALLAMLFMRDSMAVRAFFAIGLVLCVALPGRRGKLGLFLGAISYPLYLNHWVGAFAGNGVTKHLLHLPPDGRWTLPAFIALAYAASLLTAAAAWWLVDRRVMIGRDSWYSPARGKALGTAAYGLVATGMAGGVLLR